MFCANFARIEGCYYQIPDLMTLSIRRVLNLTYTWLFDLIGGTDEWEKDFKPIFDPEYHEDFDYVDVPLASIPEVTPLIDGEQKKRSSLSFGL